MVMLVEIPDPADMFTAIVSFLVGLAGFYAYYKIKPYINMKKQAPDSNHLERLEYYERQLIDMKIRLDALGLEDVPIQTPVEESEEKIETTNITDVIQEPPRIEKVVSVQAQRVPNMTTNNATDHVLQLITAKSLTSRDIQITLGRSREHTARLMKKLYEDGYVDRNTETKPYTYSLTEKGRERLDSIQGLAVTI